MIDERTQSPHGLNDNSNECSVYVDLRDIYESNSQFARHLQGLETDVKCDFRAFYGEYIAPILKEAAKNNQDASQTLPEQVRELFQNERVRALAFLRIATYGIPSESFNGEARLLLSGLIPHIGKSSEELLALGRMAPLMAYKHPDLYQKLGEHCRREGVEGKYLLCMLKPFVDYTTHNARNDAVIAPWVDCYSTVSHPFLYETVATELAHRLALRGHLSSYDHLLEILCQTKSESGIEALRSFIAAPAQKSLEEIPPPPVGMTVKGAILMGAACFIRAVPFGVPVALGAAAGSNLNIFEAAFVTGGVIGLGSAIYGVATALALRDTMFGFVKDLVETQNQFIDSPAYQTCVRGIYEKLKAKTPENQDRESIDLIESNPAFKDALFAD
jgi:hypothetical protein